MLVEEVLVCWWAAFWWYFRKKKFVLKATGFSYLCLWLQMSRQTCKVEVSSHLIGGTA